MTAEPETDASPVLVSPDLLRVVRNVAIGRMRLANAARDYETIQKIAHTPFAAVRNLGHKNIEIVLPDGTVAGLVVIKTAGRKFVVDDAELEGVIAGNEPDAFEDIAQEAALKDPAVVALLAEHFPRYVQTRVKPDVLKRYDEQLQKNNGHVVDAETGTFVRVAEVYPAKSTGEYAVTWADDGKGMIRLQEALDAGLLSPNGEDLSAAGEDEPGPQTSAAADGPTPPRPEPPAAEPAADPTRAADAAQGAAATPSKATTGESPAGSASGDDVRERMDRALGTVKPKHAPTKEQSDVIDAMSQTTDDLTIEAGAGTGKTTTLQQAARATSGTGYYLVFNTANAREAKAKFPRGVKVTTTCGLAMSAVGKPFQARLDKSGQVPAKKVAELLRINMPLAVDGRIMAPQQQARLALAMVKNFMLSDALEIGREHVPDIHGLISPTAQATVAHHLMPFARRAWDDLTNVDGQLKFTHDVYVKLWQLSRPQLYCDYVLLDEAQDTNPVVLAVLNDQKNTRLIVVGDSNQAIYEWRKAVNALDYFGGRRLQLSQSFRFGPAVADEANKWLAVLESDLRLRGFDAIPSITGELAEADAILCRTNATALGEAMRLMDAGVKVGVVGDKMINDLRWLADAAIDLKANRGTSHPDLLAFANWAQVQDHAENDPTGSDLAVLVRLIDDHTPEKIISYVDRLAAETDATTRVATAHRTKGLEFDSVRIAGDFRPPTQDPEHPDEEPTVRPDLARLAYVAVTRARKKLDATELQWVNRFIPQAQP